MPPLLMAAAKAKVRTGNTLWIDVFTGITNEVQGCHCQHFGDAGFSIQLAPFFELFESEFL